MNGTKPQEQLNIPNGTPPPADVMHILLSLQPQTRQEKVSTNNAYTQAWQFKCVGSEGLA